VSGQHLPPDYTRGDESTVGGYALVHSRPPAFEGVDGASYSADVLADETGDPDRPWGGYLFFVRWSAGVPALSGHVESAFLHRAPSEAEALAATGRISLRDAQQILDGLLQAVRSAPQG
jgi:hypothetical protein